MKQADSRPIVAKPFLKWAGGKGQLLQQFQQLYPISLKQHGIKNFYEPFLGSGAVFFNVIQQFGVKNSYLYDVNEELILAWTVVQQDVHKLLEFLERYEKSYKALSGSQREEYYYEQRTNFNLQRFNIDYSKYSDNWIPRAAQLIFLNRTCFNGLFRVNSKGEFNTPMGDYANPLICDESNLTAVSSLLGNAHIQKAGYAAVLKDLKPASFVYFDPPYRPISKTAVFTSYSKFIFDDKEQKKLATLFKELDALGASIMLSNSDPRNTIPGDDFFDELYKGYHIVRVDASRKINSQAARRGSIREIVVTNYAAGMP